MFLAPARQATSLAPEATLAVNRLSLHSFRNYKDFRIDVDGAPIVILGPNGAGKTNLLESLSLLVPGRGLRKAALQDLQCQNTTDAWGVAVQLVTPNGSITIGTGRDPAHLDTDRRVIHCDGRPLRQQSALAELVAMTWITPDMDRLLGDSPSMRRAFLDRLAYSFDPTHNGRIARYEKAMRDRLHLLRQGRFDPAWLNALEHEMAETGIAIAAARTQLVHQLESTLQQSISAFPRASISLLGEVEKGLIHQPALVVEENLRQALFDHRATDRDSGMTHHGPHRSDLSVVHTLKQCPARLCSTGEQKSLLIAIILAYARLLTNARGMPPILLLDDIAAHLDHTRRQTLFEEIGILGVQAWATGTDANDYDFLDTRAQFISVA